MARSDVRSARGELVNFDLLKIKQQMADIPKPVVVEARENFVDNKFKRQLKRQAMEAAALATNKEDTKVDEQTVSDDEQDKIKPVDKNKGK